MASFAACSSAVAAASSLWQAKAKARSASGSEGRSAEASDIPASLSKAAEADQNKQRIPDLSNQHGSRRRGRCYRSPPIHCLDQQRQLRRRQCQCAVDDRWPDELIAFKPLGEQAQTAAVPVQAFQVMTALAAEDEDVAAERIGADDLRCLRRQAVKAGAQIDRLGGEKDLRSRRRGHPPGTRNAARTRRAAFPLMLLSPRPRPPSGRSISIPPTQVGDRRTTSNERVGRINHRLRLLTPVRWDNRRE